MRTGMKQVTLGVAVSFTVVFLAAGCGKRTQKVQVIVDSPTPTVAQRAVSATASPTPGPSVSARSSEGDIQIDLPDEQGVAVPTEVPAQEIQAVGDVETTQQTPAEVERTGETITLYDTGTDAQIQVYGLSDGEWVDEQGAGYHAEGAGQWADESGKIFSVDPIVQEENGEGEVLTLYSPDGGGSVDITQDQEGGWYDAQGINYQAEGAGQWSDENGGRYSASQ